jgi:hypothetical protein
MFRKMSGRIHFISHSSRQKSGKKGKSYRNFNSKQKKTGISRQITRIYIDLSLYIRHEPDSYIWHLCHLWWRDQYIKL